MQPQLPEGIRDREPDPFAHVSPSRVRQKGRIPEHAALIAPADDPVDIDGPDEIPALPQADHHPHRRNLVKPPKIRRELPADRQPNPGPMKRDTLLASSTNRASSSARTRRTETRSPTPKANLTHQNLRQPTPRTPIRSQAAQTTRQAKPAQTQTITPDARTSTPHIQTTALTQLIQRPSSRAKGMMLAADVGTEPPHRRQTRQSGDLHEMQTAAVGKGALTTRPGKVSNKLSQQRCGAEPPHRGSGGAPRKQDGTTRRRRAAAGAEHTSFRREVAGIEPASSYTA